MHFPNILPCTSNDNFDNDNDASTMPSATTTMISAGSEPSVHSGRSTVRTTTTKKWRARALSPIRIPKSLRLWTSPRKEDELEGFDDSELPSPIIRVSSRPTRVASPTWNRNGERGYPSIDGMVFTTPYVERGPVPRPVRRTRPVSSIIPMSATARAMEEQAFRSTIRTSSSRTDSTEERTIVDVDVNDVSPLSEVHVFDSQTFNVRLDPSFMTTCNIVRPVVGTHGRRLRRCLSLPRDLGRAFQSFSCIHSDDVDDQDKENIGYEGPKSANPHVTSFKKGVDFEMVNSGTATWASIFGLMEASSKRRSAVFGKLADEFKIEHGRLAMPQVEITVTRKVFIEEIEPEAPEGSVVGSSIDDYSFDEGLIEEVPRN
ncbi:hypothetical protein SCHPADRAFT_226105 [Schizopora paradoxa]|uniref:Uncharacterized protein n=1 Tax=Schizopora paradoxa TaxID=27342 RepID=A0A0H2RVX5_9AGAM|nr:hypothetical protein SCHPADRAFT_226105 [Schizopora paradoxa]